jgi:hypothetical protein
VQLSQKDSPQCPGSIAAPRPRLPGLHLLPPGKQGMLSRETTNHTASESADQQAPGGSCL